EGIATARWREIAGYLATGSKSDMARAAELEELFAAIRNEAKGADLVPRLLGIFFTQKGERRGSLMTRALATKRPDILTDLEDE
ncbi:hypothetical protein ACMWQD_28940, partial [Escherichia coli]|uniref:hypothetical protein n=1 Tax=Escherichia coli TaxID=562 RepID=UPI0039DFEFFA